MAVKNQKVYEASKLGRKIDFWRWVENYAKRVYDHSRKKIEEYSTSQDTLLNEIKLEINISKV